MILRQPNYPNWIQLRICQTCPIPRIRRSQVGEVLTQPSLPRVVPSGHQLSLNVAESPGKVIPAVDRTPETPPSLCHSCSHTPVASGIKGWGNSDVIKLHKLHWLNEKYPNSYLVPVVGWNLVQFHWLLLKIPQFCSPSLIQNLHCLLVKASCLLAKPHVCCVNPNLSVPLDPLFVLFKQFKPTILVGKSM